MKIIANKIFLTLIIALSGCFLDNREYRYVDEETVLSIYKGAKLVYINELSQKNTFIVNNRDRTMHENTLKGQADEVYDENYYFEFINVNDTLKLNKYHINIKPNYLIGLSWGTKYFVSNTEDIQINSFDVPIGSYNDVHLLKTSSSDGIIDTLYYHYKYGVLKFKDDSGNNWLLNSISDNYFYSR